MWVRKFITLPWLVDGWCVFCTAERGEHGDAGDWTNQRLKTEGPLAEPGNHDETCIWREAIEYIDASRSEVPDPR